MAYKVISTNKNTLESELAKYPGWSIAGQNDFVVVLSDAVPPTPGAATWGSIAGDINNQLDLMNLINSLKVDTQDLNIIDTTTGWTATWKDKDNQPHTFTHVDKGSQGTDTKPTAITNTIVNSNQLQTDITLSDSTHVVSTPTTLPSGSIKPFDDYMGIDANTRVVVKGDHTQDAWLCDGTAAKFVSGTYSSAFNNTSYTIPDAGGFNKEFYLYSNNTDTNINYANVLKILSKDQVGVTSINDVLPDANGNIRAKSRLDTMEVVKMNDGDGKGDYLNIDAITWWSRCIQWVWSVTNKNKFFGLMRFHGTSTDFTAYQVKASNHIVTQVYPFTPDPVTASNYCNLNYDTPIIDEYVMISREKLNVGDTIDVNKREAYQALDFERKPINVGVSQFKDTTDGWEVSDAEGNIYSHIDKGGSTTTSFFDVVRGLSIGDGTLESEINIWLNNDQSATYYLYEVELRHITVLEKNIGSYMTPTNATHFSLKSSNQGNLWVMSKENVEIGDALTPTSMEYLTIIYLNNLSQNIVNAINSVHGDVSLTSDDNSVVITMDTTRPTEPKIDLSIPNGVNLLTRDNTWTGTNTFTPTSEEFNVNGVVNVFGASTESRIVGGSLTQIDSVTHNEVSLWMALEMRMKDLNNNDKLRVQISADNPGVSSVVMSDDMRLAWKQALYLTPLPIATSSPDYDGTQIGSIVTIAASVLLTYTEPKNIVQGNVISNIALDSTIALIIGITNYQDLSQALVTTCVIAKSTTREDMMRVH